MRHSLILRLLTIALLAFGCLTPTLADNRVDLAVCGVGLRTDTATPDERYARIPWSRDAVNGVLYLGFTNKTNKQIRIPFCMPLGTPYGLPMRFRFAEPPDLHTPVFGGAFSRINYKWTNGAAKNILNGTYDINNYELILKGKEQSTIMIPIQTPNAPGLYKLIVDFDNRNTESVQNSFGVQSATGQPGLYFRASAEMQIKVE